MKRVCIRIFLLTALSFCFFSVYASEQSENQNIKSKKGVFTPQKYSSKQDMAFISVMGSRPDSKALQGFQRAVLFNAQGVVIKKVDISSDSIYSLDKMIQENKTKGPLFIRMYR
jgi:glutaredoxin